MCPQHPTHRLNVCAVPTWTLHRRTHQPVHRVPPKHLPRPSRHAGPRRLQTLWSRQQERQGIEPILSAVIVDVFEIDFYDTNHNVSLCFCFFQDHSLCYSDCHFTHAEGNVTLTYDFSLLGSVGSLLNGPSFTSKGTKYFHHFNISLCGGKV